LFIEIALYGLKNDWRTITSFAVSCASREDLDMRKMGVTELAEKVGIARANISSLKNGKAKAIRLSTLEAICKALECQPGGIWEYNANLP
jgi:putative transcriptional regulator